MWLLNDYRRPDPWSRCLMMRAITWPLLNYQQCLRAPFVPISCSLYTPIWPRTSGRHTLFPPRQDIRRARNPGALDVQLLGYHVYEVAVLIDQVKEPLAMYPHHVYVLMLP